MRLSSEPSTITFSAQDLNDRLLLSVGMDFYNSRIHSAIRFPRRCLQIAFLSFNVYSFFCKPLIVSILSIAQKGLKGLFQETSGAWINFVNPREIIVWSIFEDVSDATVLLSIWSSYESHAKNLLPKEKVSRTFLVYSIVKSLFIHPLDEVTITHHVLNSPLRVFASRFAFFNTINGFNFIRSAFAVKHTDTRHFSWPVDFIATVRAPVLSNVWDHIRPNKCIIHCYDIYRWIIVLSGKTSDMEYGRYKLINQSWRIFFCDRGFSTQR